MWYIVRFGAGQNTPVHCDTRSLRQARVRGTRAAPSLHASILPASSRIQRTYPSKLSPLGVSNLLTGPKTASERIPAYGRRACLRADAGFPMLRCRMSAALNAFCQEEDMSPHRLHRQTMPRSRGGRWAVGIAVCFASAACSAPDAAVGPLSDVTAAAGVAHPVSVATLAQSITTLSCCDGAPPRSQAT